MPPSEESQGPERGSAHGSTSRVASQPANSVSWHILAAPDSLSWNPRPETQQREPTREFGKPYMSADDDQNFRVAMGLHDKEASRAELAVVK